MTDPVVRAVIVEDEPAGRTALLTFLADEPRIEVAGVATNGREAVDVVRRLQPDLLFLDVQLPDLDGFQVLDALAGDVPRGLVFVTAHDEHAIRAFEVHALDYVLKPFGRPRFTAAVARALERLSAQDALTLQRTLASMAAARRAGNHDIGELAGARAALESAGELRPRRLLVRNGARVVVVDIDTIDWIEASGDYVRIHAGARAHLVSERLRPLESLLDPDSFLRTHRSLIVNLRRVRELSRDSDGGGSVVLHDGVRLRVARSRWDMLVAALGVI